MNLNQEQPTISIIIRTYNRAYCLGKALDSVIGQTYKNWEIIIVDNQSTDGTDELLEKYHDTRIRKLSIQNKGVIAASFNLGLENARGTYIAILDSDDWWDNRKLETCIPYLKKGADLVYHSLYIVERKDFINNKKIYTRKLNPPVYEDLLKYGNVIPLSSVVARTELMRQIGGFSEANDLVAWEDFHCWLKLSEKTDNFQLVPHTLGYYWFGGGNLSTASRILENLESMKQTLFIKKNISLPFWYYDRKALAYHQLDKPYLAYTNKFYAFMKAAEFSFKWKILKVAVKWIIGLQ